MRAALAFTLAAVIPQVAVAENRQEREALREAKENYKTQMQYQGQYGPPETTDLKREYQREVAKIQEKYDASSASDATNLVSMPADKASEPEAKIKEELRELHKRYMKEEPMAEQSQGQVKAAYRKHRAALEKQLREAQGAALDEQLREAVTRYSPSGSSKHATDSPSGSSKHATDNVELVAQPDRQTADEKWVEAQMALRPKAKIEEELRRLHDWYMRKEPMAEEAQGHVKAVYHRRHAELEKQLREARRSSSSNNTVSMQASRRPADHRLLAAALAGGALAGAALTFAVVALSGARARHAARGFQEAFLPK